MPHYADCTPKLVPAGLNTSWSRVEYVDVSSASLLVACTQYERSHTGTDYVVHADGGRALELQ